MMHPSLDETYIREFFYHSYIIICPIVKFVFYFIFIFEVFFNFETFKQGFRKPTINETVDFPTVVVERSESSFDCFFSSS